MKKLLFPLSLTLLGSAQAATQKGFDAEFYGFLKASAMYSTEALGSFNNINMSAPTHAVAQPAISAAADKTGRLSFQTAQSRAGVNLKKGDNLSAKFEFDFIDFSKSSPTTQMNPRVRIASVTYLLDSHSKFIIGQDWDLFSPVNAYTFDYVGMYFQAGNVGFMRQQLQYLNTQGNWEFGAAVGMAGNNPGITDNDLELGKAPTYSGRASYALSNGRVGLSGIYGRLKYAANDSHHESYGLNAFMENTFGEFGVKTEAYYGQNLNNIGSLGIGKGNTVDDVKEYGGHLTGNYKVTTKNVPFAGVGLARVDNSQALPAFNRPVGAVISAPGISSNFVSRLGWEYKVTDDFSWISELSRYETTSKLTATNNQTNIAYGLESGVQLRF
jgi:hypothetical protein